MSPRATLYLVLIVALGVLPWVELWLMLHLGLPTWLIAVWCVVTGLYGWRRARKEDLSLWIELESDLQNGRVPTAEGVDAMLELIGAWGLILPGLITDVVGAVLLTRRARTALVEPVRDYLRNHWIAA
jgi:UPF0716 protein FxsA